MRGRTSAVVTLDDIKQYAMGKGVTVQVTDDGVEIESRKFTFHFKPQAPKFKVRIEATDDPSDSDEKVTPDPVKFIAGFLGQDIPGGEHFQKMSASPDALSGLLRRIAFGVELEDVGPRRLSRLIRRAAVLPDIGLLKRVLLAVTRTAAGLEVSKKEISDLLSKMKDKGWKVEERDNDGLPELSVDVSGIYEATITLDSVPYDYVLSLNGDKSVDEKGVTEDPINAIRAYVKSPEVERASKEKSQETTVQTGPKRGNGEIETSQTELAPGSEKTVFMPPGSNDKTVAPKKKT